MTTSPPRWQRRALGAVFLLFLGGWLVVGVRGLVRDDSRWAWGMFPYVLAVEVKEIRFVDDGGAALTVWQRTKKPRLPRIFRPGRTGENWGYGKGAYDELLGRVLEVAARDAPDSAVAVEAVIRTQRSERPWVDEIVRRELKQ
jgi:hypothetical protein